VGTIAKALKKYKAELAGLDPLEPKLVDEASIAAPPAGADADLAAEDPADAPAPAPAPAPFSPGALADDGSPDRQDRKVSAPAAAAAGARSEAALQPAPGPAAAVRPVDPSLVSLLNPDGMEADLFRVLRTQILFPKTGKPPRTILVTSALPEEGKSFVAANLAINMARNVDEHVLLVDCDLRKPTIHTKFGFEHVKGLSEYLSAGAGLASLLLKTGVEKLTLLPSGAPPRNPSELITSSRMAALIQELKARYYDRYIIFDSPPPMMAPETGAISKWVDGTLLVVKYGRTPMELVEQLIALLGREKILGAVINHFNLREFRRYSYSKYYGYAYKKPS
jgi:exopolysaccharide/PEP-CTERM locus tyrosine autokinase